MLITLHQHESGRPFCIQDYYLQMADKVQIGRHAITRVFTRWHPEGVLIRESIRQVTTQIILKGQQK